MNKILISIKPEYADRILEGTKRFEYRTKRPKKNIDSIIIYWTFPTMKVLAKVEVIGIKEGTPEQIWKLTNKQSGIQKNKFFEYFRNRKTAYAFELGKVCSYKKNPKTLSSFGCNFPPQSFIYLK